MSRVLSIAYTYYASDPRVRRMCTALADRGDDVECLCLRGAGEPPQDTIDGVRVLRVRQGRYRGDGKGRYFLAYLAFAIRSALRVTWRHVRSPYHAVHVNNMPNFLVFSALVPRLTGARLLLDVHDTLPEQFHERFRSRGLAWRLLVLEERVSVAIAHQVISVHELQRRTLEGRGVPARKLVVLMNLPDERIWKRNGAQFSRPLAGSGSETRSGPAGEPFLLSFHGTLTRDRGLEHALLAVHRLRDRLPHLRLQILGDGDAAPRLRRMIDELAIREIVDMPGTFLPVDALPARLHGVDLGIVPAHADWGLPTKLLEYVLLGVPCITPRTRVISHYFSPDMVKFVTPGDVDELTAAIEELVHHPERRYDLAASAMKFVSRYSWARERLRYYQCIDGHHRKSCQASGR